MEQAKAVTYSSYLALDELLGCQRPVSDEHDELLFIVVHQVYELWFKQVLHELALLQRSLEAGNGGLALQAFKRILTILKTIVGQVDVLETMTPMSFGGFRPRLEAASGFQSAQFRELEAVVGQRDPRAVEQFGPGTPARLRIEAAWSRPSLWDSFRVYLGSQGFEIEPTDADADAALLAVYRAGGEAATVSERMVDLDEGLQEWRYRHVRMVERTIGTKAGTGGSSGAEYLRSTLFRPPFPHLWSIRAEL